MTIVKTRSSVFETNSSSTHSISIDPNIDIMSTTGLSVNKDGKLVIKLDEDFGWGIESHDDAYTKAQYLLTQCLQYVEEVEGENLSYEERYVTSKKGHEYMDRVKKVIAEVLDLDVNNIEVIKDGGIIDHQSACEFTEILEDEDLIKDVIFNPGSILRIDNDNH